VSDVDIVADASAILALLQGERFENFDPLRLVGCRISAVNFSEVVTKLLSGGLGESEVESAVSRLDLHVVAFDRPQAQSAARLWQRTRAAGLSLGDRACLALALQLGSPAVTADRIWQTLDVGAEVVLIR
jgi:ribonuclease VapC